MNAASATPDPLPPLGLTWGIKRSFIAYITGLPDGTVSATDGATVVESSLFCFAPEESDYDVALGTGVLRFRGDVRLGGHHGMLFVRLLDPWIAFTGGRGVLSISTGGNGGQDRTAVGFLHAAAPREVAGSLLWEDVEVVISPEGAELFDGQYAARQSMDPLFIRVKA
ncbi:HtaA domain-containing protein [Pseudarthrobacter albicanus]|uniref:HtaA domain-containing protein n=1 Tax=Pseudarthrobacter albicanus TaxID=2823873 RepID=UPI001BAA0171|nr:HtaA domain-containing protein [Pseudarthrobacter albicanus]